MSQDLFYLIQPKKNPLNINKQKKNVICWAPYPPVKARKQHSPRNSCIETEKTVVKTLRSWESIRNIRPMVLIRNIQFFLLSIDYKNLLNFDSCLVQKKGVKKDKFMERRSICTKESTYIDWKVLMLTANALTKRVDTRK